MGRINSGGSFPWPLRNGSTIDGYDDLPREIRDILKKAPYNANIESLSEIHVSKPGYLHSILTRQTKEMALHTYGLDHPQAQS